MCCWRDLTRDETGRQFVYDAWNRLVEVKDAAGATLKSYAYDGLDRRVQEIANGVTTDLYYSAAWQVLEERVGGQTTVQYVWSPVYVDALVLRDRDSDADGTLEERLWVVQDANWNVTALIDNTGAVVERYVYDPFGSVTVLDGEWNERSTGSEYDCLQ
jgi:YD repeat-containing protein